MKYKNQLTFTTGQFAKMHQLNNRTLHYYDQIGLFSPAFIGENGYRYYTYRQSPVLEFLLAMRELDMSIDEIKAYMDNRTYEGFRKVLQTKTVEIDNTIDRLTYLRNLLTAKEEQLNLAEHVKCDEIEMITCPQEYLLLSEPLTSALDDDDLAVLVDHMQNVKDTRLFNKRYGTMISIEKIKAKQLDVYDYYYSIVNKEQNSDVLHVKPAGTYIRVFSKGNWEQLPEAYERIKKFAADNNVVLTGYAYEEGINEMVISSMDDYITQIVVECERGDA